MKETDDEKGYHWIEGLWRGSHSCCIVCADLRSGPAEQVVYAWHIQKCQHSIASRLDH